MFAKHRRRVQCLTSLGLLTSLKDSGESSVVVVVVETFRPEPQRSMSPLLSTPLRFFLSLSGPPPTLPLTLLPEFCSNSQSDHLPPAPAREEEGKFHSVTLSDGGGSPPRSPPEVPSQSSEVIGCKPAPHSATQTQLCHCFNSGKTAP